MLDTISNAIIITLKQPLHMYRKLESKRQQDIIFLCFILHFELQPLTSIRNSTALFENK